MKLKYVISVIILVSGIALVIARKEKEPRDFKGQVSMHSHQLLGICNEWLSKERPTNITIAQFASRWADFGLLVYTNNVFAEGAQHQCLFAVRAQTIPDRGVLAVTTNRTVVWIGDKGMTRVIRKP